MSVRQPLPDGLTIVPDGVGDINNPPTDLQELQQGDGWGRWTLATRLPNASGNSATGPAYFAMRPGDTAYVEGTGTYTLNDRGTDGGADAVWAQASGVWSEDEVTPTLGQVTFILSSAPIDPLSLTMRVNGTAYDNGVDYSVSGVTVTWLNLDFTMETTDKVHLRYQ